MGLEAQRTLVKSPPELWAELSDAGALARHLGEFGEIRITRLEPETTVAWEGEHASGTVELAPSGWGTKVTIIAELARSVDDAAPAEPPAPPPTLAEAVAALMAEAPAAEGDGPAEEDVEPAEEPAAEPPAVSVSVERRARLWSRLFRRRTPPADSADAPAAAAPPGTAPPATAASPPDAAAPPATAAPAAAASLPEPPPVAVEPPPADPPPTDEAHTEALAVLTGVLDNLGTAHHRPFSRG